MSMGSTIPYHVDLSRIISKAGSPPRCQVMFALPWVVMHTA